MAQVERASARQANRREFVLAGAGVAAEMAALGTVDELLAAEPAVQPQAKSFIQPGDTILFQGDSITDAGRKRGVPQPNSFDALGTGYAWLASAEMLVSSPDAGLKIFNHGISGNKVYQLAERWQADCLDIKPNLLSILIGVNDFWHKRNGNYEGTLEKYESDYHQLLRKTKDVLPDVKLVICEPFVLEAGAVDHQWIPEFAGYRAAAKRVAQEAEALFVPFQTMFDRAATLAPPKHWAADGVHPTTHGAALMANAWLNAVGTI